MDMKFDTSGSVNGTAWSDISPFAQGYVEAMFASLRPDFYRIKAGVKPYGGKRLKVAYRMFDPDGGPLREVTGYVHVSASKIATAQRLYRAEELELPGFADLAPETLARIIADCEEWRSTDRDVYSNDWESAGRGFWAMRQSEVGEVPAFPPLTVQLGDDGKVRFAV